MTTGRKALPRKKQNQKPYSDFGQRVRDLRTSKKWSIQTLADQSGVNPGYLSEVERGARNPTLEVILSIASALDVNAGLLVDGLRAQTPKGLEAIAEHWLGLSREQQQTLIQLAEWLNKA